MQNSRTVPTSVNCARSPTSTPVSWKSVITCALGGCAQELPCQCISSLSRVTSGTRRFLWTTATRLSQVFMQTFLGSCTLVWMRDTHLQSSVEASRSKGAASRCKSRLCGTMKNPGQSDLTTHSTEGSCQKSSSSCSANSEASGIQITRTIQSKLPMSHGSPRQKQQSDPRPSLHNEDL